MINSDPATGDHIESAQQDRDVNAILQSGATGYLLKKTPPARILEGITEVMGGGAPMNASIAPLRLSNTSSSMTPIPTGFVTCC